MRSKTLLPAFLCLLGFSTTVRAQDLILPRLSPPPSFQAGTPNRGRLENSNCAGAPCDTVWLGHSASGRGGSFLGVGVGGVWDFDQDVAGTDSSQGWRFSPITPVSGNNRPPATRLDWATDLGNQINLGNTALWAARELAGRKYVRRGVAGAWHSDDLVGVKTNIANAGEPSAVPIAGTRSAWCGLRPFGDTHAIDALSGNALTGDLLVTSGSGSLPEWPGYANQWDQMLYKDFVSPGSGTVAFRLRTDLSPFTVNTGWFNPDPTSASNLVLGPADSIMVYVGSPNESAYDTNRRWFSEVLDLSKPVKEIFTRSDKIPVAGTDSSLSIAYAGVQPVAGSVRVVFRIKTNRALSDQATGATSFNSKDGAAVLDEVSVNGGFVYGFENASDVLGRGLIPDLAAVGGAWATTGRPPSCYEHVQNIATLVYGDLCGGVGSPTRRCNLAGNVLLDGDHDQGEKQFIEHSDQAESPTIDLTVRHAPPGTKDAQGLDAETAQRGEAVLAFDFFPGFVDITDGVFFNYGLRLYAPSVYKQPISGTPVWSGAKQIDFLILSTSAVGRCISYVTSVFGLGFTPGQTDSVRIVLSTYTNGWRFGGGQSGVTDGTYFDNVRFGLVRDAPPALDQNFVDRYQDQFPFNESVAPGDVAAFDTTSAYMRTARWLGHIDSTDEAIAGDSLLCIAPYGSGDGTATGTRVDLVFRIDPGPGSFSTPGNRSTPLVNRDPAHPFYATYLANNGPFGTPGGHGAAWNPNVWNSARMDSAELNVYLLPNNPGLGPQDPYWMGTLHELDPNYGTLGIVHPVCFLSNPATVCDGTVPPLYGAASGTTKEGTKILPDGWFTPGTHIEYFLRRSQLELPGAFVLLPDTSRVTPQGQGANLSYDLERWENVDVLPDFWKSVRYGGPGLACMLLVDNGDRMGADPAFRGAADSLGLGKGNGASSGWRAIGPRADPNDPAGFVAANRGGYGLNYDHYDVGSAEVGGAGWLGVRTALNNGVPPAHQDRSGPSVAMAVAFYSTIVHAAGAMDLNSLQSSNNSNGPGSDAKFYAAYLGGSTPAAPKNLWLSGDNIAQEPLFRLSAPGVHEFLRDSLGVELASSDVRLDSGSQAGTTGFVPTAAWAHPGRVYGFNNDCVSDPDRLAVAATVADATEAAHHGFAGPGPWTASIYRPRVVGVRNWRSLFDGFDLSHLRGTYLDMSEIGSIPETSFARLYWFDDVANGLFQICARRGPVIGLGDVPGGMPSFANANLGAAPNPAVPGSPVLLRFSLAHAGDVTIRLFTVGGREVARIRHPGKAGENGVRWDGRLANGAIAAPGVYFYALEGAGFAGGAKKLVLLTTR